MKEIYVHPGTHALVDDSDYEILGQFKWYLNTKGYAQRNLRFNGRNTTVKMARQILDAPKDRQVDHINRVKLDNRSTNLRLVTNSENQLNKGIPKNNTSGYKNLSYRKASRGRRGRWAVCFSRGGSRQYKSFLRFADALKCTQEWETSNG